MISKTNQTGTIVDDGIYYLKHKKSGKVLSGQSNALKFSILEEEPYESQLWKLRITPSGTFLITMFSNSNKMLFGGGDSPPLIESRPLEKDWCGVKQVNWRIEKGHEEGAFYIVNGVGKVLDGNGNKVYFWESKNQDGYQMWELISYGDTRKLNRLAKEVKKKLEQKFPKSREWGVTYNNTFPNNWIIQVPPMEYWGTQFVDPNATKKEILERLRNMLKRAETIVDIMTLDTIHESFTDILNDAISYLEDNKKNVTFRIFLGKSLSKYYHGEEIKENNQKIYNIIKKREFKHVALIVETGRNKEGWGWNHAKIVAVDGKEAIVGGMNMYEEYLSNSPVHDLSVHIKGMAAYRAQEFAENYWKHHALVNEQVGENKERRWKQNYPEEQNTKNQSPIIIAGRYGKTELGDAPSDVAILTMLSAATKTIYISQQKMFADSQLAEKGWEVAMIEAICGALSRNEDLQVKIVTSYPGEKSASLREKYLSYNGNKPLEIMNLFARYVGREKLLERVKITNIARESTTLTYNHAKVVIVDEELAYIGSQNLYDTSVVSHTEFGFIIADPEKVKELIKKYWERLWRYSYINPEPSPKPREETNKLSKLPQSVAEQMKWMAWNAAWYAANKRANEVEQEKIHGMKYFLKDAEENEQKFHDHANLCEKLIKKTETKLTKESLEDIKWGAWHVAWYAAHEVRGEKKEAESDYREYENKFKSLIERNEMTEALATTIKNMSFYAAWTAVNERAAHLDRWNLGHEKITKYDLDAEKDKDKFERYSTYLWAEVQSGGGLGRME
ncbi:phospholipase D-like domain-containing protein [Coleofasciculus sp.]|uniref:phospholipase D-like domain-containing protein n=1 Tax=Coleofasciculus sp. TaxID=3100458 RepID=UPI0039FA0C98